MLRGTPDHPKTLALASFLGVHRLMAVGALETLWQWTARFAPAGDIGRWADAAIASGIHWDGEAAQLIEALVECKFLDRDQQHRLLVHDWPEHADDAVHRVMARAGRRFADGSIPRLRRLGKKEQSEVRKLFSENDVDSGRPMGAQRAHCGRPSPPRLAPPSPAQPEPAAVAAAACVPDRDAEQQQQPNPTGGEICKPDVERSEVERLAREVGAMSGRPWEQELRDASAVDGKPGAYMRPRTIARASPEWIDRTLAHLADRLARHRAAAEGAQRRDEAEAAALRIREGQVEFYRERDRRREAARSP